MNKLVKCVAIAAAMLSWSNVNAQQAEETDWDNLSLEQLMNIPINSASKKDETLFDAPLSSYTITRQDIDNAGSTSIMEALRLAPGVIVREQTNGNYDIHIRGFDNLNPAGETSTKANLATLVMIDNRPVFNNNLGGTFWEALPVDINDVDRIEIVRGPSAPLFGPNAVSGVINIITKKVGKDKTLVNATLQGGSSSMLLGNVSAGKSFDKFSVIVSGNYQKRDRFQETYYIPATAKYLSLDEMAAAYNDATIRDEYADAGNAVDKFGANLFLDYNVSEKTSLSLTAGTQQSEVQKIFLGNVLRRSIPLTTSETKSSYVNLAAKVKGLNFRTSYVHGTDNNAVNAAPSRYDYDLFDGSIEYTLNLGKIGTLTPGANFHSAVFSDEDYADEELTFLGGDTKEITTTSAFIRTDLQPIEALRILGAIRVDKFSTPDDAYLAYELATTYKINSKNLVRAAITRSNSGSFVGYNYLNLTVPLGGGLSITRSGSTDLDLYTINMIEAGYRSQISPSFQIDLDVFHQKVENLTALHTTKGVVLGNGTFVPTEERFVNVPMTATQLGFTLGINYVHNDKLHIKPFVTIQETETKDIASSELDPALASSLGVPVTYRDSKHKNTPSVYGGYYINYKFTKALNLNINGYYFASHRQYDQFDPTSTGETGEIKGKVLLNAKISYGIKKFTVFVNGRNLLNSESSEFYGADDTRSIFLAGASFSL